MPNSDRPNCAWCQRRLRRYPYRNHPTSNPKGSKQWGDYGDNLFCGLRCGYHYAVNVMGFEGSKRAS